MTISDRSADGMDGRVGQATSSERMRQGIRRGMRGGLALVLCLGIAACQATGPQSGPGTASAVASRQALATPAPAVSTAPLSYAAAPATAVARGYSELVIDMSSGRELYALDADAPRFPASLTKMMTLYLLFEEVSAGRMSLDTPLPVSAHAASQPPSRLGLRAGETITVEQAARAMAVKSANDVAVVVAEAISGSETAFAAKMNAKARALGLRRTRFRNASGLPDPGHVSTARDLAVLGRALKTRFSRYGSYFRARHFSFHGRTYDATNNLLGKVAGVDGLKTGYIRLSGYNLVATASRGGRRLLVVVIGGSSERARDTRVTELLAGSY